MLVLLYAAVWVCGVSADAVNSSIAEDIQECGGTFNSSQFYLSSPGLPQRYPPGLECSWTLVTASSACSLTLDLGDLRLSPCPSDQLVIGDVQLCGDVTGVAHLPLNSSRINITFRGNPEGGPAFNISVQKSQCSNQFVDHVVSHLENLESYSCKGEFDGDDIEIVSPGYPSSYPPEANCKYTVRRSSADVCQVEITFENSTLEPSEGCYKDRLEIQGDRLCGELKGVKTYGIDDSLEIRFTSDSFGSGQGFKLLVKQVKCAETPIVVDAAEENDKQDIFVDCEPQAVQGFHPEVEEGYPRVKRPFPPFPYPDETYKNYPPLQDGFRGDPSVQRIPPGTSFPQHSWRYPSSALNPSTKYTPNQVFIPPRGSRLNPDQTPFAYNPIVPNSFNPAYTPPNAFQTSFTPQFSQIQQCCGRIYTDSHFLIVSPGFPRSQSSDCIYTIQRYSPLTLQIRFQFRYFWVGQDTGTGCSGGALEIDGNRICGCKTGFIWTSQYYDSESVKVLHLRLDSSIDRLFNGFVIEVYQDESYSRRVKRGETGRDREEFIVHDGKVFNFTQNIETIIEREPLVFQNNGRQPLDANRGRLVWDANRQTWTSPTDYFCLRWSFQDWVLLAKETLWSQYQCPVSPSSGSSGVDSPRLDVTACRTCYYFCRQNCRCC